MGKNDQVGQFGIAKRDLEPQQTLFRFCQHTPHSVSGDGPLTATLIICASIPIILPF
jgi:hypothetical protein